MSDELPTIEPEVLSGVPFCSDNCPQHDGKRCRLLGAGPGNICEPGVDRIIADRNRLQNHVPGLSATLDELKFENARLREELAHEKALHEQKKLALLAAAQTANQFAAELGDPCVGCGQRSRITTAGCDHCDYEDK